MGVIRFLLQMDIVASYKLSIGTVLNCHGSTHLQVRVLPTTDHTTYINKWSNPMISNPCLKWVNHTEVYFTYEGGDKLYNFQPNDCDMSKYMESNLLLWANSEEHARDVIIRMFEWYVETPPQNSRDEYVNSRAQYKYEMVKKYLTMKDKIKCVLAPTNQMYKAAWANNDTFIG